MKTRNRPEEIPIEVSARILRHIGRGIYRTPAAALKELVSNSYDARATEVTIDTGYPVFETMIVRDNGDGMSKEQFKECISHIGFTNKVAGESLSMPHGYSERKMIGHFGIGLLAIGQLAKKAVITSKTRGEDKGFVAEIDFEQFELREENGLQRAIAKDETELATRERLTLIEKGLDTKLPIGTCKINDLVFHPDDRSFTFTEVKLETIRFEVKKKLSGEIRDARNPQAIKDQQYSASFDNLLALLREHEGEIRQGQYPYEKLCWELAVYCPTPYREMGPFTPEGQLNYIYDLVRKYGFNVKIDGFTLTKPFESSFFEDQENPIEEIFSWNNETYMTTEKGAAKVTGYMIYKRRIRPNVLQGVLVRSGGIAIGLYDTTFLEYPYYEGFKFSQLTGELFAEGLSGALNIDRNSFNETDDCYLALADWLHDKLQTYVFPKIKAIGKEVSSKPRAQHIKLVKSVLTKLADEVNSKYKRIKFQKLGKKGPLLKLQKNELVINEEHPDGSGSGAKIDKLLFAAALVIDNRLSPNDVEEIQSLVKRLRDEVRKSE